MKKIILKIYIGVLILGVLLMISALLFGDSDKISRSTSLERQELVPNSCRQVDEDTVEYLFSIDHDDNISRCVEFYTNHQYVTVYADGESIYQIYPRNSVFGNTAGTQFNFVELPTGVKEVRIDITAAYPSARGRSYSFYEGDAIAMYQNYIRGSLLETALSFFHVVFGLALAGYWLIFRKKVNQGPTVLYFSIAVTLLGLWGLNETDLVTIMVPNHAVASFISYTLLMLMIAPYVRFIHHFLELPDKWISNGICLLSIINYIVCTVLHMTGILAFKQTVVCTHLLLVLTFFYLAGALIWRFRKFGFDHLMKVNAVAAGVFLLVLILDFFAYYTASEQTDVFGRVGILVYVIIIGIESISGFIRQLNEGRKAEIYKQLAVTDVMTGMFNRSAFEKWEEEQPRLENLLLITFDLNNLKKCNDTMGHAAGDHYIVDAAKMIRNTFGGIAKCYRIGGDEFCAVTYEVGLSKIKNYIEKLRSAEEVYNRTSGDAYMKIACGYACYETGDQSVEDIRSRADVLMYENKKKIKEKK